MTERISLAKIASLGDDHSILQGDTRFLLVTPAERDALVAIVRASADLTIVYRPCSEGTFSGAAYCTGHGGPWPCPFGAIRDALAAFDLGGDDGD